jgi:hypothetical protein
MPWAGHWVSGGKFFNLILKVLRLFTCKNDGGHVDRLFQPSPGGDHAKTLGESIVATVGFFIICHRCSDLTIEQGVIPVLSTNYLMAFEREIAGCESSVLSRIVYVTPASYVIEIESCAMETDAVAAQKSFCARFIAAARGGSSVDEIIGKIANEFAHANGEMFARYAEIAQSKYAISLMALVRKLPGSGILETDGIGSACAFLGRLMPEVIAQIPAERLIDVVRSGTNAVGDFAANLIESVIDSRPEFMSRDGRHYTADSISMVAPGNMDDAIINSVQLIYDIASRRSSQIAADAAGLAARPAARPVSQPAAAPAAQPAARPIVAQSVPVPVPAQVHREQRPLPVKIANVGGPIVVPPEMVSQLGRSEIFPGAYVSGIHFTMLSAGGGGDCYGKAIASQLSQFDFNQERHLEVRVLMAKQYMQEFSNELARVYGLYENVRHGRTVRNLIDHMVLAVAVAADDVSDASGANAAIENLEKFRALIGQLESLSNDIWLAELAVEHSNSQNSEVCDAANEVIVYYNEHDGDETADVSAKRRMAAKLLQVLCLHNIAIFADGNDWLRKNHPAMDSINLLVAGLAPDDVGALDYREIGRCACCAYAGIIRAACSAMTDKKMAAGMLATLDRICKLDSRDYSEADKALLIFEDRRFANLKLPPFFPEQSFFEMQFSKSMVNVSLGAKLPGRQAVHVGPVGSGFWRNRGPNPFARLLSYFREDISTPGTSNGYEEREIIAKAIGCSVLEIRRSHAITEASLAVALSNGDVRTIIANKYADLDAGNSPTEPIYMEDDIEAIATVAGCFAASFGDDDAAQIDLDVLLSSIALLRNGRGSIMTYGEALETHGSSDIKNMISAVENAREAIVRWVILNTKTICLANTGEHWYFAQPQLPAAAARS